MNDPNDIQVHPAASLFPMMTNAELDDLAADIVANGLQQPPVWIETAGGGSQLLDGRNRAAAIARIPDEQRRAEVQLRWREFATILPADTDAVAYAVSANLRRRHLTVEQRHEVIAALLEANPARSDRATAKIAHVDGKTVAAVRAKAEDVRRIPHVNTRTDTRGRQQPATKPAAKRPPVIELARDADQPNLFTGLVDSRTAPAKPAQPPIAERVKPTGPPLLEPSAPAEMTLADAVTALKRHIDVDAEDVVAALVPVLLQSAATGVATLLPALRALFGKCIMLDAEITISDLVAPCLRHHHDHLSRQLMPTTRTALAKAASIRCAEGPLRKAQARAARLW
jgi:ParB-like chromosome segregation protein Spo0J